MTRSRSNNPPRSAARRLRFLFGYGVGDLGLNIYWNVVSLFLIYWYTVIVGLPPSVAGAIFLVSMIWDAISDPIVASISERVSTRFGTYRPFVFYGSWLLLAASSLLFWVPPLTGVAQIAILVVIVILFRTAYTLVAVPYAAMSARLSFDSMTRTDLSGARMFFAYIGLLIVSFAFAPLVRAFSSSVNPDYSDMGFQFALIIAATVATASLLLCFVMTRELKPPESKNNSALSRNPFPAFFNAIKVNRMLRLLLGAVFLQSAAGTCLFACLVFYVDSNADMLASKERVLGAFALATFLSVPIWTFVIQRLGRKLSWTVATLALSLIGLHLGLYGSVIMKGLPVQIIAMGLFFGVFGILVWAFVPDSVEHGQILTGQRAEAASFGSLLIVQKISGGLAGFAVGIALENFGFQSGEGSNVARGLELFLAIAPASLLIVSLLFMARLPHDRVTHAGIVDRLLKGDNPSVDGAETAGKRKAEG